MRWDDLFDDLESQLEQELGAEDVDVLAEEERLRLGRLTLRDRLLAMTRSGEVAGGSLAAEELRLALRDGQLLSVAVGSIGRDWLVGELRGPRRGSCLVPLGGIGSVLPSAGQLARSVDGEGASEAPVLLSARLGLSFVLRDLCRRRAALELSTASGERMHGTIDRVGRDHLDLAEHEAGVPRRAASVTRIRILPLEQLVLVRF
jgi:hypothetical protein